MSKYQKALWLTHWLESKQRWTTSEKISKPRASRSTGTSGNTKNPAGRVSKHIDPVTGDPLTFQELVSWRIQGVIRHWAFLVTFTLATFVAWLLGIFENPIVLIWWNLLASYLAIFVENIVGIAMFSQTRRDAVILRRIASMEEQLLKLVEHLVEEVEEISEDLS